MPRELGAHACIVSGRRSGSPHEIHRAIIQAGVFLVWTQLEKKEREEEKERRKKEKKKGRRKKGKKIIVLVPILSRAVAA